MKVLVTGNLGYIGTVLTPMLLSAGHEVVGFDCDYYRHCTYGQGIVEVPQILKDIRDARPDDLKGFDAVLHLAALSNDPLGDLDPQLTFDINHRAAVRLAEMARDAGVERFVFSSSCSTYGAAGDDFLDESAPFNPVTPYGKSKMMVEHDVSQMADDRFSPIFLRNSTAYGVSPRLRFDLVLNNLVALAFTTGQVMMKSDGTPWRPIVHIEDISRAFIASLDTPRHLIHNQAFNIGLTEDNLRIRDIAAIVAETVPDCVVSFAPGAAADKRCYRVNCNKARRVLRGFEPQWNVRRGARQLYEAYCRYGLSLDEFEGPRYQRIAHIRKLIAEGTLDARLRFVHEEAAVAVV